MIYAKPFKTLQNKKGSALVSTERTILISVTFVFNAHTELRESNRKNENDKNNATEEKYI